MTYSSLQHGLLNLPGSTPQSKTELLRLLRLDYEQYHCVFNTAGMHNHLSHHLLAAYDLGAPTPLLTSIFEKEAALQRPADLGEVGFDLTGAPQVGEVNEGNWTKWLGDERAYPAYVNFFADIVRQQGISGAVDEYLFGKSANEKGVSMLLRFMGGLMHPIIHLGFGIEFAEPMMVTAGLAQCAVGTDSLLPGVDPIDPKFNTSPSNGRLPLLGVLRDIYDSSVLTPIMPYDADYEYPQRFRDLLADGQRQREMERIVDSWHIDVNNIDRNVEEAILVTTLIVFGTGKSGRLPRLDFFTNHFLTSAIFFPSILNALPNASQKIILLKTWFFYLGLWLVDRGRPRIDSTLLMSYSAFPKPPLRQVVHADASAVGAPNSDEDTNPWPIMLGCVIHAPDAHTIKTFRALYWASQQYGTRTAGSFHGVFDNRSGSESHRGISKVDGTLFVRAAGILMDMMGWVTYGEKAGKWDRSGLGWDAAWEVDDITNREKWRALEYEDLRWQFEGKEATEGDARARL
ncbi:hypothetical protein SISSUDRAFT_1052237 [Sistotremastrum suecicum HHB10207 ss-3]|uniref:Uncharacterized protein n=1 Tax=Sistotremastrum suecicum HHB10207 ss-3 TaxID=1314776 RepID=A0A166A1P5_9AGAM|nr:hypothetical protein SISSUDRAFT_1052237 [Sistotremastrum suecicum HHB10207 ss-3]